MKKFFYFRLWKTVCGFAITFLIKGRGLKFSFHGGKLLRPEKFAYINSIGYDFGALEIIVFKGRPVTHLERIAIHGSGF